MEVELPKSLDTPEFRVAWAEFEEHRRQIRKKMTPLASKKLLNKLEQWGHERSVLAIDHSIANGWTGIFEPEARKRAPSVARIDCDPAKYDKFEPPPTAADIYDG